jgi:dienelactone hydrolase
MSATVTTRMRDRALLLFATASALIALHAVADAFIAPERGTTWDEHLTPGLATLGVLAASVVLFARSRPGVRGALAILLGALAIEGAALAALDARNIGPRGDDWTGLLLAPTGLALCGLGVGVLWQARKGGRFRYLRRTGLALLAVVGIYWVAAPLAMSIAATHRPRQPVADVELGRAYERVSVQTRDGLTLAGWYVRSRNRAAVISYPTRKGKLPQARMLIRHGYGVLLLDARGYDGSEGDPNLFGWNDAKDIDAAVGWLQRRPDVRDDRIGGIGFSVGGEMMLQTAAANEALRAVVSDGAGFRSVREELLYGPRGWFTSLPGQAVLSTALTVMSGTTPPPSLKALVPRIAPRHVFFVYAGHGAGGEEYNPDYYAAAAAAKAIWRIPEARHTRGYQARPREYEKRVVAFFDHALLGRR